LKRGNQAGCGGRLGSAGGEIGPMTEGMRNAGRR
jgi:hypothetical protein